MIRREVTREEKAQQLRDIGAERILRRSGECQNSTVVRIETAIYSR
jgi:hypothetical protein